MNLRRHLPAWGAAAPALLFLLCARAAQAALPTVPSPTHEAASAAPSAVGAGSLLQAGFGMAVVVGLIFLRAWLARRFGLQRLAGGQHVKVVSSAMVGQRERVVVIEVADTWVVLGVTASQVNTLHTLPAQAASSNNHAASPDGARGPVELFARKLRESLSGKAHTAP